jgi:hypothetical protein
MATNENDTDPSTPSARRLTPVAQGSAGDALGLADTQPTALAITTPAPPRPSTNPGLGPPPERRAPPTRPIGIVVPPVLSGAKKDSVELLLDGITGPQPERPKTMPQTDGEASAVYHARHDVRPARTSPDDIPKVVVERPLQSPTLRIDRSRAAEWDEAAVRAGLDTTAVEPPQIGPRVVVALVAGLLVVLALFVALRLATHRYPGATTVAPAPTARAAAIGAANSVSGTEPASRPASSPVVPAVELPPAPTVELAVPPRPVPASASAAAAPVRSSSPKPKPKPGTQAAAPSRDLSELKTTFQ